MALRAAASIREKQVATLMWKPVGADWLVETYMLKSRIYQGNSLQYNKQHPGSRSLCFCQALRAGQEFLWREAKGFQAGVQFPLILRLDAGSPAFPGSRMPSGESVMEAGWDVIHSADVLSGLAKSEARLFVRETFMRLNPGGRLLLGNVSPDAKIRCCPVCSRSKPTLRTGFELAELTHEIAESLIGGQAVFSCNEGTNVYLEVHRRTRK